MSGISTRSYQWQIISWVTSRKHSCQKKLPQSFALQTMMCLENSIRVCHFWHLNRKFTVEHEKDCVGYGATYTNGTTRTFQKCKKKSFETDKRSATFKYLQNEKNCKLACNPIDFQFFTKQSRYTSWK